MARIDEEVALLRKRFPDLTYQDPWVLLPAYPVPDVGWGVSSVQVAFSVPAGYPGQKPYAFCTSPVLQVGAANPTSTTQSTEPPFAGVWLKFSWDCPEWLAGADVASGSTLLHWAMSFGERLADYS